MQLNDNNIYYTDGVKENEQCWRKHVNIVCLLFKNDLNHLFNSAYDEVQITQQCTRSLVIDYVNKLKLSLLWYIQI